MTRGHPSPRREEFKLLLSPLQRFLEPSENPKAYRPPHCRWQIRSVRKSCHAPYSSSLLISISSDSVQAHPFKPRAFKASSCTRESRILAFLRCDQRAHGVDRRTSRHILRCLRRSATWVETARIWCVCKSSLGPFDAPRYRVDYQSCARSCHCTCQCS